MSFALAVCRLFLHAGDTEAVRRSLLRRTLTNPWLIEHHNGISCIDRCFDCLALRTRIVDAGA